MVDVQLNRLNELRNKEGAGATFEGRQLPRQRMRRLMFSKPVRALPTLSHFAIRILTIASAL